MSNGIENYRSISSLSLSTTLDKFQYKQDELCKDPFYKVILDNIFNKYKSTPNSPECIEALRRLLLVYRLYATPEKLIYLLNSQLLHDDNNSFHILIQQLVSIWVHTEGLDLSNQIIKMILLILEKTGMIQGEVNKIKLQFLKLERNQPEEQKDYLKSLDIHIVLKEISANHFAKQLTLVEWQYFSGIKLYEIVSNCWQGDDRLTRAPTLSAIASHFDKVSFWIVTKIVTSGPANDQFKVISYFIRVLWYLYKLRNFNGVMQVLSALNNCCIQRLKNAWKRITSKSKEKFDFIDKLMSPVGNMSSYRAHLLQMEKLGHPVIPYFGLYLRDVTYVFDGNPTYIDDNNTALNYDKIELLAQQVLRLQKYQTQKRISLFLVPPDNFLVPHLLRLDGAEFDEEKLYSLSLLAQPLAESAYTDTTIKKQRKLMRRSMTFSEPVPSGWEDSGLEPQDLSDIEFSDNPPENLNLETGKSSKKKKHKSKDTQTMEAVTKSRSELLPVNKPDPPSPRTPPMEKFSLRKSKNISFRSLAKYVA